jgi:hypothetical protein
MNARNAASGDTGGAVDSPIRVAFVISILVHVASLVVLLPWLFSLPGLTAWDIQGDTGERLEVELASQPGETMAGHAVATPASHATPAPAAPSRYAGSGDVPQVGTRQPVATKRAAPRVPAVATSQKPAVPPPSPAREEHSDPAPGLPAETPAQSPTRALALLPTPSAANVSPPAAASVGADLSSYIAARRRERYEQRGPTDDDVANRTRIIASDAPALRSPIADERTRRGGGVFEITRMADDDAQFVFFGWNRDEGQRKTLTYQVRLGDNGDMRIAVVRTMIAIIREHEDGDFRWQSYRLGHIVVLSARRTDNAGLENFMLKEFFDSTTAALRR